MKKKFLRVLFLIFFLFIFYWFILGRNYSFPIDEEKVVSISLTSYWGKEKRVASSQEELDNIITFFNSLNYSIIKPSKNADGTYSYDFVFELNDGTTHEITLLDNGQFYFLTSNTEDFAFKRSPDIYALWESLPLQ